MGEIETRNLGDNGQAYVREHLGEVNVFCAALLETVNSQPGGVFTLAPAGTTADRLAEFRAGGLLRENQSGAGAFSLPDGSTMVPVVSLIGRQAKLLRETMMATSGAVCIIDDFNPRWGDTDTYFEPTAFGVGEETYHVLTAEHGDDDFASAVHNGNALWHAVTAVCRVAPSIDATRASTPSELRRCAASAILITCIAHDGEGFVAWQRGSAGDVTITIDDKGRLFWNAEAASLDEVEKRFVASAKLEPIAHLNIQPKPNAPPALALRVAAMAQNSLPKGALDAIGYTQ
ncbi:MAG: hypothetical protein GC155_14385 [Alphaproteobacteria bacterium]|nr:hypothetical protein [Alphaproteobacteria bacterium]